MQAAVASLEFGSLSIAGPRFIARVLLPSLNKRWSREQECPALSHFVHRPTASARLIDTHHEVVVVLTHREVRNADHVGHT